MKDLILACLTVVLFPAAFAVGLATFCIVFSFIMDLAR